MWGGCRFGWDMRGCGWLFPGRSALVPAAVESRHGILPVSLAAVGQDEVGLTRDSEDIIGVVDAAFLALGEAVDDVTDSLLHGIIGLGSPPDEAFLAFDLLDTEVMHLMRLLVVQPGIGRDERRAARLVIGQRVEHALEVACDGVAGPPGHAVHIVHRALQAHLVIELSGVGGIAALVGDVLMGHDVVEGLAIIHVAAVGMIVPPVHEHEVAGSLVFQFPVELRHHIVHPPLGGPLEAVGIQGVVALQPIGLAAVGVTGLVAPDAEGADAEAHPGLHLLDGIVQLLDEQVHVVAAPVALVPSDAVGVITGRIGKVNPFDRIGIKVVVHVDGINIISLQDVAHHAVDEVAALGQAWVKVELTIGIVEKPLGVLVVDMARCRVVVLATGHTIGVDPRVQLHTAAVALVDHKLQGIPQRTRGFARLAGNPARPWLELANVGRIGLRSHLPDDGITSSLLQLVELVDEIGLVLLGCLLGILLLPDDVHPCSTELMFGVVAGRCHILGLYIAHSQCHQHQECEFE